MVFDTDQRTFRSADIYTEKGYITRISDIKIQSDEYEIIDLDGAFVIPGLVDVHTHGRSGYDFNNADSEGIEIMLKDYAKSGTTTIMPTLASVPYSELLISIDTIKNISITEGKANIAGLHLEGRYLSPEKRGTHDPAHLSIPSISEAEEILSHAGRMRAHFSLAPELDGADDMIKYLISHNATVSAAHSNATYDEALDAVKNGVSAFTHTYNAMRSLHHREPGNCAAALLTDSIYAEFICDGIHVAPPMIELARRLKPKDKFVLITDSMEATGCPDGDYSISGLPVKVINGKAVNSEGALAGSTLTLFKGLVNFIKFTDASVEDAICAATINPAKMIKADDMCGSLRVGLRCDMIVIDSPENLNMLAVYAGAQLV